MKRAALAVLALSASPLLAGSSVVGSRAALATSSPYATRAGLDVLKRGGNAADAAVAAELSRVTAELRRIPAGQQTRGDVWQNARASGQSTVIQIGGDGTIGALPLTRRPRQQSAQL